MIWQHTDVVGAVRRALPVPVGFDTDTNGAALGERRWGAGHGMDPLIYVTVGTGIGFGVIVDGKPVHGLMHPEAGHLPMPVVDSDTYAGYCPFHGRCLEGLASGPAIKDRMKGRSPETLADDDPVWDLIAAYLAYGFFSASLVVSPRRIVVGGEIGSKASLLARVRRRFLEINHGYVSRLADQSFLERYLVSAGLGGQAGVMGAFELARRAEAGE